MKIRIIALAASAMLLAGPPTLAHHSFAMFDLAREDTVEGVVREFQFTFPHVWIQVLIPDGKGGETEWGFEAGTPSMMTRTGWKSSMLKPGDKVTIVMNPLRTGKPSGRLVKVTLPDGRVMGPGGPPPPPPPKVTSSPGTAAG